MRFTWCSFPGTDPVTSTAHPHTGSVLEVDRLSVRFGNTDVLRGLTLRVHQGASLAIIGPNGAGKTVLLRALIGAIPHEGVVRWADGSRVGYVPQKLDLERDIPITGRDFLRARLSLAHDSSTKLSEVLQRVGVSPETANKPVGTISGGQFQRLLLAFALLGNPSVLLLDEPTAGVDEPGQEQINLLLRRLQQDQNLTIVFISHDLSVVYENADQVLCLSRGRPYIGTPREILTPDVLQEAYGMPLRFHVHEP
jgi:zinc transport system ATP-binding protein